MATSPTSPALETVPACLACGGIERRPWATTKAMLRRCDARFAFSRCEGCGLVFLDPRVPADALGPWYGPDYLPHRGPAAWGPWRRAVDLGTRAVDRRRVASVRARTRLDPSSRVLDVGCGQPTFLEALRRSVGCRCTGVDLVDAGWREAPDRWDGLELLEGVPGDVDLTGPYDLVTMWHFLEHDYDPVRTLRRMSALAHEETRLVIEVPDFSSWPRRRYGECWAGYHTPRHTAVWDARTLPVLLRRAGWEPLEIEPRGTLDAWTVVWMSRQERAGIDWAAPMASRFPGYVAGRVLLWPWLSRLERLRGRGGDGLLTAVARPA